MTEPLATLNASPFRRYLACFVLFTVGVMLVWIGVTKPPASAGWQIYLIGLGAIMLWLTVRFWQASGRTIVLTKEGVFEANGRCLARIEDIAAVERGVFAFKPSNGFLIRLKTRGPRGWAPGLWWSVGRRVGVGGVTPAAQGKYMAEILAMEIAE